MPGKEVKNWPLYEQLRSEGHTKESAARIANAQAAGTIDHKRKPKK